MVWALSVHNKKGGTAKCLRNPMNRQTIYRLKQFKRLNCSNGVPMGVVVGFLRHPAVPVNMLDSNEHRH
jgi:hypothetical protein